MLNQCLQRPDGVIAYDDQGEGLLVLCVPAGGDLRTEYRFLTPALVAAGYRVATMDLRGQGQSSASWPD
jgi:alpha-beta hydrolase superfamily lysophospholipase